MLTANLNPRQKIYLTAALWLAVLTLIIATVIAPMIAQIRNDGLELALKKQEMAAFSADWQLLEKDRRDYQAMQNEINALPAFLPENDALKFIMLIEKVAQATGNSQEVSVDNADEANAGTTSQKTATDFQINLRGNWPNLIKFMIYLENAPYYNDMVSLQTQRLTGKDGQETGEITSILKISAHQ